MAMNVSTPAMGDEEDEVVSAINTTPLVDVMLVLLIIFLITVPVVTTSIQVQLPKETVEHVQAAIRDALGWARAGDVMVIAGKGHETYQVIGTDVLPFDDRAVAREFLAERWS